MRRAVLLLVLVAVLPAVAACTGRAPATPPTAPPGAPDVATSPAAPFVRTCDSSVYGALGRGWERDAVVAGPIAFVGLGPNGVVRRRALDQRPGPVEHVKVLAVVSARTRVTVSVDRAVRERLALSYDPSDFDQRSVGDGQAAVVFDACEGGATRFAGGRGIQFNGGLVVDGWVCGALDVTWSGGHRRVELSLGRSC